MKQPGPQHGQRYFGSQMGKEKDGPEHIGGTEFLIKQNGQNSEPATTVGT